MVQELSEELRALETGTGRRVRFWALDCLGRLRHVVMAADEPRGRKADQAHKAGEARDGESGGATMKVGRVEPGSGRCHDCNRGARFEITMGDGRRVVLLCPRCAAYLARALAERIDEASAGKVSKPD